MMQTTDFGNLDDRAELRPLDGPTVGRIFVKREVSSRPVIVREVAGEDAAQVPFAEDEDMIQTLLPDRADKVLREGEIGRRGVVREGVDELLGGPGGGGRLGHVEVEDAPALVGEDDQDEEHAQVGGRNGEETGRPRCGNLRMAGSATTGS